MIRFIRTHATYANVIATMALFFSLSGVGMATHLVVRSSDIKDNEVKSIDVRNDSLTGTDIKESTLEGSCPRGMVAVGADLCYDKADRTDSLGEPLSTDFRTALTTCSNAGLRLPSLAEAYEAYPAWSRVAGDLFWTGEAFSYWYEGTNVVDAWLYGRRLQSEDPTFLRTATGNENAVRCLATRLP